LRRRWRGFVIAEAAAFYGYPPSPPHRRDDREHSKLAAMESSYPVNRREERTVGHSG